MEIEETTLIDRGEAGPFDDLTHQEDKEKDTIPLIPVRGMGAFPGMVIHFDIERTKSVKALEMAMTRDQLIFLSEQRDIEMDDPAPGDIYPVGTIAKVKQTLKMPDNLMRVLVEIRKRAEVETYVSVDPCFVVTYHHVSGSYKDTKENRAVIRLIKAAFTNYLMMMHHVSGDLIATVNNQKDPDAIIDLICANLMLEPEEAQRIMQETDTEKRLYTTYEVLVSELEMVQIEQTIDEKVKAEIDQKQREYVLREQIKVIQEELGEEGDDEIGAYEKRLKALDVSDEVRKKVEEELDRLEKLQPGSPEAGVITTYLDWILSLPWNTCSKESYDVAKARKILNRDHYALDNVKERILEYISVLKLSEALKSPILCLVGPPGVGKTSIAKSIAKATGRKYVRMSLGGLRDEAEIRGHRRTYIGAIPGRILYHLKQAGTSNPLFLLDEIDKMSQDFRGDPASALLEVLDPEQNFAFTDNYLELPFDLSKVLFLTTANSLATIPRPLLDRMEIIEVNGYVPSEKLEIGKRYLVPKQRKAHGLKSSQLTINKSALQDTIDYYTRESGVRELERKIAQICRVAAKEIVEEDKQQVRVTAKNLTDYLGIHKFTFEKVQGQNAVGLVNGLAWTEVGGETLEIEVAVLKGSGKLVITGQLGDVMQESAKAAISYIRSRAEQLHIAPDFYEKKDIHLHVPEGAVPKDGPSAGITMTTALISALSGKPVPRDLAMTGEITLRGRVLPIGGLREKLTAAHRAGITHIILPKENAKDLEEVPEIVLKALSIQQVETMEEVTALVFGEFA
jgi:ATP-dependent Lon protease